MKEYKIGFVSNFAGLLDVFCNESKMVKVKVKFSLEQAMKAQRGSRGIALLFL
jgi:hypothetical protein